MVLASKHRFSVSDAFTGDLAPVLTSAFVASPVHPASLQQVPWGALPE